MPWQAAARCWALLAAAAASVAAGDEAEKVHVVYSASSELFQGVYASMASVVRHAAPGRVALHLLQLQGDPDFLVSDVEGVEVRVTHFGEEDVRPYVNEALADEEGLDALRLKRAHNYARFVAAERLPASVKYALLLDSDTLVTLDLLPMVQYLRHRPFVVAAYPRWFLNPTVKQAAPELRAMGLQVQEEPYFNAGVMGYNLELWRWGNWSAKVRQVVAANNARRWWTVLGSQPPLNLLLGGPIFDKLDPAQLVGDLGWNPWLAWHKVPGGRPGHVYHWNGERKPWSREGYYNMVWEPYCLWTKMACPVAPLSPAAVFVMAVAWSGKARRR